MTKHWEAELEALKGNNAKLTAALLESTANVKQWKQQLAAYQEEAERLHKRVRGQRVSFLCTLNEFNQRRGGIWKGRTLWRQDESVARNNRLTLAPRGGSRSDEAQTGSAELHGVSTKCVVVFFR